MDEPMEWAGELSPVSGSSWDFVAEQNWRRLARDRRELKELALVSVVAGVVCMICHATALACSVAVAESALEDGYDSSDDSIFDDSDLDDF